MDLTFSWDSLPAIIPVLIGYESTGILNSVLGSEYPHIPKLYGLILRISYKIASIPFGIYESNPINMTSKDSYRFWMTFSQVTTIPDLKEMHCLNNSN